jgi:hypothetical protein
VTRSRHVPKDSEQTKIHDWQNVMRRFAGEITHRSLRDVTNVCSCMCAPTTMSMMGGREHSDSPRAPRRSPRQMHAMFNNVGSPPFMYITRVKALA